jgi:hypothetical protein
VGSLTEAWVVLICVGVVLICVGRKMKNKHKDVEHLWQDSRIVVPTECYMCHMPIIIPINKTPILCSRCLDVTKNARRANG